jgi:hypothetical protein
MKQRIVSFLLGFAIAGVALTYWQVRMVPSVPKPTRIERWSADLYESYLPVWTFAYAGAHLVPRWNPYQLAGSPFLASVTGAPVYPLNFLATVVPVPLALGWSCAFHVALAGVFTFACARAIGLSRAAATLAAVGFMLSGRVLAEHIHPPYLFGVAWLPMVFLAAGHVLAAPGPWRGTVLGACLGAQLLAGYPEIVCFTTYALLLLLIAHVGMRGLPVRRDAGRLAVAVAVAVLTAGGLAAVQLLPTIELVGHAVRSFQGLSPEQSMPVPPPRWEAVALTAGPSIGLALAAFTDRRRLPLLALGVVLIVFVCAVGFGTPFYTHVFRSLPGVKLFRLPQAIFPIGVLALALLAGFGLDALTRERSWIGGAIVLAAAPLMLLAPRVWMTATLPIAVLAVAATVSVLPGPRARSLGAWVVVALFVTERFVQPGSVVMIPQGNASSFFDAPPLVAYLREHVGFDRALVIKNWKTRFPIMEKMGTLYGFPVVQDYEPLTVGAYRDFLRDFETVHVDRPGFSGRFFPPPLHSAWPRLDLLGVRYVAVAPSARWKGELIGRFRLVYDAPDGRIFENTGHLPRAFLASRSSVVPDLSATLARMDTPGFRPLEEAIVDREIVWASEVARPEVPARVTIDAMEPESVTLHVSTPERAVLVLSDLFWPGWGVTVDGAARDIYRVDYLLRGVAIEAGEHVVHFRYAPSSVRYGAALTIGTGVALAVWALAGRLTRRRSLSREAIQR